MEDEEIIEFIKERMKKHQLDDMNKELREWMEEHGIKPQEEKEEEEKIEGKCEICEIREAKYRCIRCGKIACMTCFWTMLGICKECITEKQMKELKEHYF